MDGEQHHPAVDNFQGEYVLRGWTTLAGILAALLLVCTAYELLSDHLGSEPAVLASPPVFQLNINTATAAQLQALPAVGVALAERIVSHRSEHGPFQSVADLQAVRGLGPTKIAGLRGMLTVSGSRISQANRIPVTQLSSHSLDRQRIANEADRQ